MQTHTHKICLCACTPRPNYPIATCVGILLQRLITCEAAYLVLSSFTVAGYHLPNVLTWPLLYQWWWLLWWDKLLWHAFLISPFTFLFNFSRSTLDLLSWQLYYCAVITRKISKKRSNLGNLISLSLSLSLSLKLYLLFFLLQVTG